MGGSGPNNVGRACESVSAHACKARCTWQCRAHRLCLSGHVGKGKGQGREKGHGRRQRGSMHARYWRTTRVPHAYGLPAGPVTTVAQAATRPTSRDLKWAPNLGTASDSKHRSAPDPHGHGVERSVRLWKWGGAEKCATNGPKIVSKLPCQPYRSGTGAAPDRAPGQPGSCHPPRSRPPPSRPQGGSCSTARPRPRRLSRSAGPCRGRRSFSPPRGSGTLKPQIGHNIGFQAPNQDPTRLGTK